MGRNLLPKAPLPGLKPNQEQDVAEIPPDPRGRGPNMLLLLVLLLLIAGLVAWAFQRNPPDTPQPAATAQPDMVPGG